MVSDTAPDTTPPLERSIRGDMLRAAVDLLHEHGPDALQTRKIAGAAGTSTMAVYTHFGGMRGLVAELAEEGFRQLDAALAAPESDDPVADLFALGAAYRRFAIGRPHLYRLTFGSTSAHGINAPAGNILGLTVAEIEQRIPSFAHLVRAVQRCMRAGRITVGAGADGVADEATDQAIVATAAQFWAMLHGFVMLELGGFYGDDGAAVTPVLDAMRSNLLVALGDSPQRVERSRRAAAGR